jgi:hypothetical protein
MLMLEQDDDAGKGCTYNSEPALVVSRVIKLLEDDKRDMRRY